MTTNLLSVIEQLQHYAHRIERSLQDLEGTTVALHSDFLRDTALAIRKLAAGQQALEQTQVDANPDFYAIPVEYQYHYPDGTWRCLNGDSFNGMKPDRARALYARKDEVLSATHPQATEPAPCTMPIGGWKVRVRGSNQELHCTGIYDNTVFVDLPAPSTAGELTPQSILKAVNEAGQKQRSGQVNQSTAQIPWTHTVGACTTVRDGADQHHANRDGQPDAERADAQRDSQGSGLHGAGEVCARNLLAAWTAHTGAEPSESALGRAIDEAAALLQSTALPEVSK